LRAGLVLIVTSDGKGWGRIDRQGETSRRISAERKFASNWTMVSVRPTRALAKGIEPGTTGTGGRRTIAENGTRARRYGLHRGRRSASPRIALHAAVDLRHADRDVRLRHRIPRLSPARCAGLPRARRRLPDISGLELQSRITQGNSPHIVFVTGMPTFLPPCAR
jgi:hypothetical protein